MTPYIPRPIRFLELWRVGNWRIKLYGITYSGEYPRPALLAAARQVATRQLRLLPDALRHYHVGFLGVHDGRTSNFVFLDFWAEENELHHHVFVSPTDRPECLADATPTGLCACVWDLRLQAFEREAWLVHVLQREGAPDFDGYLAATLDAVV